MAISQAPGKVIVVDASAGYRRTLRDLVGELGIGAVAEASTAREVMTALVAEPQPRCALISWELPEGGTAAADALWLLAPGTPVLWYTGRVDVEPVEDLQARTILLRKPLRSWDISSALGRLER